MDPAGGYESVKRLKAAGNQYARMYVIRNAGHHGTYRYDTHRMMCETKNPLQYI